MGTVHLDQSTMKFLVVLSCAPAATQKLELVEKEHEHEYLTYSHAPVIPAPVAAPAIAAPALHALPVAHAAVVAPGLPYLGPLTDGAVLHAGPKVELKALELPKIADHESIYPYFHNAGGLIGYPYYLPAPAAAEE